MTWTAHGVLMGIPQGMNVLGRPRRRCEHYCNTDLRRIGWMTWTFQNSGLLRTLAPLNKQVSWLTEHVLVPQGRLDFVRIN